MTKEEAIRILETTPIMVIGCKPTIYEEALGTVIEELERSTWTPCSKRLPDNAQHKGAFCPMYQVMTKYGVTEGWYNPDCESWYVIFWFRTTRFHETDIDFRGDIPKVVKIPLKAEMVTAWQPLPEPYKGVMKNERNDKAIQRDVRRNENYL